MRRIIIDYKKLTPKILKLLNKKFPDGYGDDDVYDEGTEGGSDIVPQVESMYKTTMVVRADDGLVIVEHFQRFGVDGTADALESLTAPVIERHCLVIQRDPDKAAELHFAAQPAQAGMLFTQTVLITFLLA